MDNLDSYFIFQFAYWSTFVVKKICEGGIAKKRLQRRSARKVWQEKWLARRQIGRGILSLLKDELLLEDPHHYRNFLRMDNACFVKLLDLIKNDIQKQSTHLREPISAENR